MKTSSLWICATLAAGVVMRCAHGEMAPLRVVRPSEMCITTGAMQSDSQGHLGISEPKVRAIVPGTGSGVAEIRFVYRGPTTETALLDTSGLRRQIGLKLRAQDSCNLVYVMWRIEPESKVVVSTKYNPGMHLHSQCGTHGYRNAKPMRAVPVAALVPGSNHTLRAEMDDSGGMRVVADGVLVWQGAVGGEALSLDGPIGLRTDNGRFDVELRAAISPKTRAPESACRKGPGD